MVDLTLTSEDKGPSNTTSRLGIHPISAFMIASVFGMGVAVSWHTGASLVVPVVVSVVASALAAASEIAFYQ